MLSGYEGEQEFAEVWRKEMWNLYKFWIYENIKHWEAWIVVILLFPWKFLAEKIDIETTHK